MKRLLLITGTILIAYLLLTTVITSEAGSPPVQAADSPSVTQTEEYLITETDGRIVIYRNGELYLRTETPVASLPKADRVRLAQGIRISSVKELKSLIEDYCS